MKMFDLKPYLNFLGRNKLYTSINVLGFAVSLMFVILIFNFVKDELSTDSFQHKADRLYILGTEEGYGSGYGLARYMLDRYPEIEMMCAVTEKNLRVDDKTTKNSVQTLFADSTFFRMFSFPLLTGDPAAVLQSKPTAVLSESYVRRMYPDRDPVGMVIHLGEDLSVTVTGVMKDIGNSIFSNYDMVVNALNITNFNSSITNEHMQNAGGVTFFILEREGSDLLAKVPDMEEYFKTFYWIYRDGFVEKVVLTPMRDFYFDANPAYNIELNKGSRQFISTFMTVGLLILLFAIINYINLTVAQTGFRAKEMASRRLLGASRGEIFSRFIGESLFMCAFSFFVGFLLAHSLQPFIGNIIGHSFDVAGRFDWFTAAAYALLIVVLGIVSGIIPAAIVSRYKPLDVVRGSFAYKSKMVFSRVFIVVQNIITIALIVMSAILYYQVDYLITSPRNHNTENIIAVSVANFESMDKITAFKNELSKYPSVLNVGMARGTPLDGGNNSTFEFNGKNVSLQQISGDSVATKILGFEVLRDNNRANDDGVWLNETAMNIFELAPDADNLLLFENNVPICGVLKDFKIYRGNNAVYQEVCYWEVNRPFYPWSVLIETTADHRQAIADIKQAFMDVEGLELEYSVSAATFNSAGFVYFEDAIRDSYSSQTRMQNIVALCTLIAIVISMLGLLAMSAYFIQLRRGEIAVRKVFGSTSRDVLERLVGNFLILVVVAFVLAVPLSWWALSRWMEQFSQHIELIRYWWVFPVAGIVTFAVAALTVLWQCMKAANANPVDSIKS